MSKIKEIASYLKVFRINNLLIIAFMQLLFFWVLVGSSLYVKNWFLILATFFIAAGGYIINDYFDVKIDLINKPNKVIIGKGIPRKYALLIHTVLSSIGVAFGFFAGLKVMIVCVFCSGLLWVYSAFLKREAFWGNIVVAFLGSVSLLMIYFHAKEGLSILILFSLFAFFGTWIREIIKDMEDIKGDRENGCRTLPVIWGIPKTRSMVIILTIILIVIMTFGSFYLLGPNKRFLLYILVNACLWVLLLVQLEKADTKKAFSQMSSYCKILLLLGIFGATLIL